MKTVTIGAHLAAAAALSALLACGSSSPTAPSSTGGGTSGGSASGATITVGGNGAITPTTVTIRVGQSVTIVNNDSRSHDFEWDPHPSHTGCPGVDPIGVVGAGATKQSGAFSTARSCSFHDHTDASNANLKGTIVAQ